MSMLWGNVAGVLCEVKLVKICRSIQIKMGSAGIRNVRVNGYKSPTF